MGSTERLASVALMNSLKNASSILSRSVLWFFVFMSGFFVAMISKPLWERQEHIWLYLRASSMARDCDYKFEISSKLRWSPQEMNGQGGDKVSCGKSSEAPLGVTVVCECDEEEADAGMP